MPVGVPAVKTTKNQRLVSSRSEDRLSAVPVALRVRPEWRSQGGESAVTNNSLNHRSLVQHLSVLPSRDHSSALCVKTGGDRPCFGPPECVVTGGDRPTWLAPSNLTVTAVSEPKICQISLASARHPRRHPCAGWRGARLPQASCTVASSHAKKIQAVPRHSVLCGVRQGGNEGT